MVVAGCALLAAGCWSHNACCGLLAAGCRLLAPDDDDDDDVDDDVDDGGDEDGIQMAPNATYGT